MKLALSLAAAAYVIGFVLVFWMHTQMPVTFGLALVRSAVWPFSFIKHDLWPRGAPLPMD